MATRRGPKPIYTRELADEILDGLSIGLTAADAIGATGVAVSTVERWRNGRSGAPAEFGDRYARARLAGIRCRVRRLTQLADDGDVRAIEAWLDRCAPDYRKTATAVDHKHTHAHTHRHYDLSRFSPEEVRGLDELAARYDATEPADR